MERRITAILAADVVGYSRLMGEDQAGTITHLQEVRQTILETNLVANKGYLIKSMGDGWIVEFPSVSDAVACAIGVQEALVEHRVIKLRIGVHTGEVVFDDQDFFGEGVNVAARLEALGDPGEVLISDSAYNSLDGKTAAYFRGGESHTLKNIHRAVGVWRFRPKPIVELPNQNDGAGTISSFNKPSIAVLPFDNMSGDPEQQYFSDGICEDILTALSQASNLAVIARNSSFSYRGQSVDLRRVGEELGVRYVLEGSVRRSGNRVRVTAQLIDTSDGSHVWAKHYDDNLEDIFAVQDSITEQIVRAIEPEITVAELERVRSRYVESVDAWDAYLRALSLIYENTPESCREAEGILHRVVTNHHNFAAAHARRATCFIKAAYGGWALSAEGALVEEAFKHAQLAYTVGSNDALSHDALASAHQLAGDYREATRFARRAIEISPACIAAHGTLITSLAFMGETEEAIQAFQRSQIISPRDMDRSGCLMGVAIAYFLAKRYEEAIEAASEHAHLRPNWYGSQVYLAASAAMAGQSAKARRAITRLLELLPGLTTEKMRERTVLRRPDDIEHLIEGLTVAGLPGHSEEIVP